MRFRSVFRASKVAIKCPSQLQRLQRSYFQHQPQPARPSFGIAFDIDGVILRGNAPIGRSPQALRRLYNDDGTLKIPYLFLTNGGGVPESARAIELSGLLGVKISAQQILQGHSPFRRLVQRFENDLIVAAGKGEPAQVMSEYGFKKVLSIDEYASYFDGIDPLSSYKTWKVQQAYRTEEDSKKSQPRYDVHSDRVKGVFVVSDPVDWGRDIQVLCDILGFGGLPVKGRGHQQPPLFFASDDLEYQFPSERLGMGAFRIALESVFNRTHDDPLEYTSFGKPNSFVFNNAEATLKQVLLNIHHNQHTINEVQAHSFSKIYMIGDNPSVDIKGAREAGHPWFSILSRTGVFKGQENHPEHPADLVVDTVEEAVDYILRREC
ncbi:putative HAD-superfamily hydrolase, subfamily IIA, HAD superfamily [Dioscorea sansibarensis]